MKILRVALAGVVFGAAGYWLGSSLGPKVHKPPPLPEGWGALLVAAVFLLVSFAVIGFHELGHVIGGRLAGFRFLIWITGPVMIVRGATRIEVRYNSSASLWGGMAASAPLDDRDLPRRMLWMVLGGPAASIVLAVAALAAASFLTGWASLAAGSVGVLSAAIGLVTALPMKTGPMQSDGARVLQLLRGGRAAEAWCSSAAATGMMIGGVRPRDLPDSLIARITRHAGPTFDGVSAAYTLYRHSMDRADVPSARHWLDQLDRSRDQWPEPFRAVLDLEMAWLLAIGGSGEARQRFETAAKSPFLEKGSRLRVEAAIRWAEGKVDDSKRIAAEARIALGTAVDRGMALAEQDWLDRYITP